MDMLQQSSDNINELVNKVPAEPILFKKILSSTEESNGWKLLDWSLDDFASKCGDSKLPFRVGKNAYTHEPQWEVNTETEYKTMTEFLRDATCQSEKWFYFDYKYLNTWFDDNPDIQESFDWKKFDLDFGVPDSTIWVGSKGAHTNCHQDTYGCNLVAQTHGRKLWLLFSPECTNSMQPTRIPYEESTVFSKFNFFCPCEVEIQAIKNMPGTVKIVTLEPGDVLFIPKGWWHYVESLETSLSVNIWLPLKEDCLSRLKESLVHLIANTIGDCVSRAIDESDETCLSECVEILENSLKECKNTSEKEEPCSKKTKSNWNMTDNLQSLKVKYSSHIETLSDLTSKNISDFTSKNNITKNISQNCPVNCESNESSRSELLKSVVDAFCNPDVVEKVSQILTEKFLQR